MTQSQQWPLLLILVLVFLAYLMMSSLVASAILGVVSHTTAASLLAALPVSLMSALVNIAVFRYWSLSQPSGPQAPPDSEIARLTQVVMASGYFDGILP